MNDKLKWEKSTVKGRLSDMKLLIEISVLAILYKLGDWIRSVLDLSIPSVLISMGILFALLTTGVIKLNHLERASQFFSRHMILFFIPVIVGIVQYAGVLKQGGWHLLFIVVISTAFVIISTAFITLIFKKGEN